MARPVALGLFISTLLALAVPPGHHGTWWDALDWASNVVFMMSAATAMVWVTWNLVHPDRSLREELEAHRAEYRAELRERAEQQAERLPVGTGQDGNLVYWHMTLDPWQVSIFQARWEQALAAGTASVNGTRVPPRGKTLAVRYPGPPPVYTPPHGLPRTRTSAECDECGYPMDVAWVHGSVPRLCVPCRSHGMAGYRPY